MQKIYGTFVDIKDGDLTANSAVIKIKFKHSGKMLVEHAHNETVGSRLRRLFHSIIRSRSERYTELRAALRQQGSFLSVTVERLEPCPDPESLLRRRDELIAELKTYEPFGYNQPPATGLPARRGRPSVPVLMFEMSGTSPIATFGSVKEAAEATGVSPGNITSCCRGKREFAGGRRWAYGESK